MKQKQKDQALKAILRYTGNYKLAWARVDAVSNKTEPDCGGACLPTQYWEDKDMSRPCLKAKPK